MDAGRLVKISRDNVPARRRSPGGPKRRFLIKQAYNKEEEEGKTNITDHTGEGESVDNLQQAVETNEESKGSGAFQYQLSKQVEPPGVKYRNCLHMRYWQPLFIVVPAVARGSATNVIVYIYLHLPFFPQAPSSSIM